MNYRAIVFSVVGLLLTGCNHPNQRILTPGYVQFPFTKTILQNTPIQLNFATELNPDCSSRGYPIVNVVTEPRNGALRISRTHDYTNFLTLTSQAECNKKRNPGVEVKYIPQADFVGSDSTLIETIYPNGNVVRIRYNIVVRPQS